MKDKITLNESDTDDGNAMMYEFSSTYNYFSPMKCFSHIDGSNNINFIFIRGIYITVRNIYQ